MTAPSSNDLNQAKIRQLLAAVGSAHAQEEPAVEVTEYDWRDPHSFNEEELNQLAAVMSQVAARIAETFARFYSSEHHVSPMAITQHFANDLPNQIELDRGCCLTFGPEKGPPCGFTAITGRTALAWVTRLLGDSETGDDPERPLSSLEESLLFDLLTAVVEGFLLPLQPRHSLKSDARLCQGQPDIQFETTEGLCKIVFQVKRDDADEACDIAFLLPCSRLTALVGKIATVPPRISPQELSHALTEHLQQMPVTVTARLASTTVSFREILDLGPGDILLLDKPIQESMELILDGAGVFSGRPVRSQGHYAVAIQQFEDVTSEASNEPKKGPNHHAQGG